MLTTGRKMHWMRIIIRIRESVIRYGGYIKDSMATRQER
jgi:hypothetical protein